MGAAGGRDRKRAPVMETPSASLRSLYPKWRLLPGPTGEACAWLCSWGGHVLPGGAGLGSLPFSTLRREEAVLSLF